VETPDVRTIEELTSFLSVGPESILKTLVFVADGEVVAILIRGDHEVNEVKLKNLLGADTLELADPGLVAEVTGAPMGFAGPVGLKTKIIADHAVRSMDKFITGANRKDFHLEHVKLERDFTVDRFADLRMILRGDRCPRCDGEINFGRGIEVGHVFKLGTKYSKAMHAVFLDEQGEEKLFFMGCYGIGIARTVAAAIEQNHDQNGIIFPISIAPFEAALLPLQMHQKEVVEASEKIYNACLAEGLDILLDDRVVRAGVKFKDNDLIGTPLRISVGERALKEGKVEFKLRTERDSTLISLAEAPEAARVKVKELYDQIK